MEKKIALVTHEYYPILSGGTVFCHKMAKEFVKLGWKVSILAPKVGGEQPDFEETDGFQVYRFNTLRRSSSDATLFEHFLFFALGLPQLLVHCLKNPYSFFIPVFAFPSGLMCVLLKLFYRKIQVFTFVDAADTPSIDSRRKGLVRLLTPLFRLVTRFSDGVFILDGIEDIAMPHIKNSKITVLPNGAEIPPQAVDLSKLESSPFKFLTIGRLVPRKGFESVIKAAALLKKTNPNFEIDIVGYGSLEAQLKALVEENKVVEQINFLGRVEYSQLNNLYLSHHCYLFCGDREGSSLAMIEAVAYGLPTIASRHPGNTTFVEHEKNGFLFEYGNIEDLTQYMKKIMSDDTRLQKFSKESRQIALSLSWTEIAKKYSAFMNPEISDLR